MSFPLKRRHLCRGTIEEAVLGLERDEGSVGGHARKDIGDAHYPNTWSEPPPVVPVFFLT